MEPDVNDLTIVEQIAALEIIADRCGRMLDDAYRLLGSLRTAALDPHEVAIIERAVDRMYLGGCAVLDVMCDLVDEQQQQEA